MSGPGFLDRWSRRKQAARREAEATATAPAGEAAPGAGPQAEAKDAAPPASGAEAAPERADPASPAAGVQDEAISEEELARLPPIEEATRSADLRPYLRRGVPEALRRQALRRMWMLNPAIRDYVDPALDYAWDFNAPQKGPTAAKGVASLVGSILGSGRARDPEAPAAPKQGQTAREKEAKPSQPERAARPAGPAEGRDEVIGARAATIPSPAAGPAHGRDEAITAPFRRDAPPVEGEGEPLRPRRRHGGAAPRPV
jgi:hypothetical protein